MAVLPQRTAGGHAEGPPWRWPVLALAYLVAWLCLESLSAQLWFLPAGLRLAALWATPSRRWGWWGIAEVGAQATKSLWLGYAILSPTFLAVCVAPWLIYAGVVLVVRGPMAQAGLDGPVRMLSLVAAGLLCAALVSPLLWLFLVTRPMTPGDSLASVFAFLYGDLIGQLVLAPLLLALYWRWRRRRDLWRDLGLLLLLSLLVFLLLRVFESLAVYVLLMSFAPLFYLGFRHGWQGAALGTTLLGVLVQALVQGAGIEVNVTLLQLELAVVGSGAMVLGAASTALRESHEVLAERHHELEGKNEELAALADELRLVTQRLVRIEEQGQRELANELDYELGQAIHALGTRVSLAFREARDESSTRLLESLREQVREIQDSLRRALRQLRPTLLDTQGLRQALAHGPLREMLDDAGVDFEAHFGDGIDGLGDDASTAVYRICQAAVREAVRLDFSRHFTLSLQRRAGDDGAPEVELRIDVEFSSFAEQLPPPQPVPAILDRVLAEHGDYRVEPRVQGQRHHIRFPLPTPRPPLQG